MCELAVRSGQAFLFIGDSITDCGRRAEAAPLGNGYVSLLVDLVTARWPERAITWINQGIGGNKVTDLQARWSTDVLAYRPDWLAVKVGINDLHSYLSGAPGGVGVATFRETYDAILREAVEAFSPKLVLMDPFYVAREDTSDQHQRRVLDLLPEYIRVVQDMTDKYGARRVRTHEAFQRQLLYRAPDYFCPEPVHPYRSGHMVIANALLEVLLDE